MIATGKLFDIPCLKHRELSRCMVLKLICDSKKLGWKEANIRETILITKTLLFRKTSRGVDSFLSAKTLSFKSEN